LRHKISPLGANVGQQEAKALTSKAAGKDALVAKIVQSKLPGKLIGMPLHSD